MNKEETKKQAHWNNILPKNPVLRVLAVVFGFAGGILCLGTTIVIMLMVVYAVVANYITVFPRSKTLAHRYLAAVVKADPQAAMRLMDDTDPWFVPCYEQGILLDIVEYGHAEVRGVRMELFGPGGSDDSVQSVNVTFQYLKPGQSDWQDGKLVIMTDALNLVKRRILMVNHKNHMFYAETSGKFGPPEPVN
ncbi:MAG: hypothetical protein ACYCZF_07865 [Anaerolineae bacterium]